MAIQYIENFSCYGTDKMQLLKNLPWANVYSSQTHSAFGGIVADPDGVSTGKVLAVDIGSTSQGSPSDSYRLALPTPDTNVHVGFRWFFQALPASEQSGASLRIKNQSNARIVNLHVLPTGQLRIDNYKNGSGGSLSGSGADIVETTTGPVVSAGVWQHIEFHYDNTDGTYAVRVEGFEVLEGTDPNFTSVNIGILEWADRFSVSAGADGNVYIKDLFVADDTGTQNNSFIGPVTIYTLLVNGDVSDTNATPSTGTDNFDTMDKTTPSDTTYTTLGTAPAEMIMTLQDVPADVVAIRALQTMVRALKTDGGDASMQVGLISNGDEDTGADAAISTSVHYQFDVSELNPDTAAAWTPANTNSAQIRINRTT